MRDDTRETRDFVLLSSLIPDPSSLILPEQVGAALPGS